MKGTGSSPQPVSGGDASPTGGRTLVIIIAAALTLVLVAAVTIVLVVRVGDDAPPPGPAATATSTPTPTETETETSTPAAQTTGPTQPGRSAAEALDPFFVAAVTLDRQLQVAAAAINATGPPWLEIGDDVTREVQAVDLDPVARAIPAGLPHDLQQAVILVFSDLTSRRYAMQSFSYTGTYPPDDFYSVDEQGRPYFVNDQGDRIYVRSTTTAQLMEELENGDEAAMRFDDDLAAARALAAASPAIAQVPTESRLTAEVLILVDYVRINNAGCDDRGGVVVTRLPTVTWRSVPDFPEAEGTVDSVVPGPDGSGGDVVHTMEFNAELQPDGTWDVGFFVC